MDDEVLFSRFAFFLKPSKEEVAGAKVFNAGHFAGYWLAWIPAHLIRGAWAGVCSAWERAGE